MNDHTERQQQHLSLQKNQNQNHSENQARKSKPVIKRQGRLDRKTTELEASPDHRHPLPTVRLSFKSIRSTIV